MLNKDTTQVEIKRRASDFSSITEKHEIDIELLKKDIDVIVKQQDSIAQTLSKLEQLSQQLAQLLQIHEQKIATTEASSTEKFNMFMNQLSEQNREIRSLEKSIQKHLEQTEIRLYDIESKNRNAIDANNKELTNKIDNLASKVDKISAFQLKLLGGIIVLGVLMEAIPLLSKLL